VLSDTQLTITSPATATPISVDVTVDSDLGQTVLPDGFTYSDSGPPAGSGDGGADGGADGGSGSAAGLTSGLVEFAYTVTACTSCFPGSVQLDVSATAVLHDPIAGAWTDWLPPKGSCVASTAPSQLTSDGTDVGDWVYLTSGSTSLGLRKSTGSGPTFYQSSALGQTDWIHNASWDLTVPEGGPWGAFDLSGVVRTTDGFDTVQPVAILNDGAQAFTAQINASSATFSWTPSGLTDGFVTAVDVYNASGSVYLVGVLCYSNDTGSVTLPASGLAYSPGSLLAITMMRYQVEEATNPVDGSTVQGISHIGLVGTGVLR